MKQSDTINELAAALAAAQGEMRSAQMNAINPFLKNRYADLASITDVIKQPLARHGLSYVQMPVTDGDRVGVTTRLMHKSGQWLEGTLLMPPLVEEKGKSAMQVAGSAISYARRYALAAMLGVVADEDTDGNVPQPQHAPTPPPAQTPKAPTPQPAQAPAKVQPPAPAKATAPKQPAPPAATAPRSAEETRVAILSSVDMSDTRPASEPQLKFVRAALSDMCANDYKKAKAVLHYLFQVESSADLTVPQARALIDWSGSTKENGYTVSPVSAQEAELIVAAELIENGQLQLDLNAVTNGAYAE